MQVVAPLEAGARGPAMDHTHVCFGWWWSVSFFSKRSKKVYTHQPPLSLVSGVPSFHGREEGGEEWELKYGDM